MTLLLLLFYFVVILGRMFDYHVLDMIELGIEKFTSLKDIKVRTSCIFFFKYIAVVELFILFVLLTVYVFPLELLILLFA